MKTNDLPVSSVIFGLSTQSVCTLPPEKNGQEDRAVAYNSRSNTFIEKWQTMFDCKSFQYSYSCLLIPCRRLEMSVLVSQKVSRYLAAKNIFLRITLECSKLWRKLSAVSNEVYVDDHEIEKCHRSSLCFCRQCKYASSTKWNKIS